jgi:hypothetical protein
MSIVGDEIKNLQSRIVELEKQQQIEKETFNKTSITYNFSIITDLLDEKKKAIQNNRYAKNVPLARYYDQELVTHLEAIYNILKILDARIGNIENANQ